MSGKIILIDTDKKQSEELSDLLQPHGYDTIILNSLSELEACLGRQHCMAVFIDIDTIPVENRQIREMTVKYRQIYFFCISKKNFNPELKNAICYHIYACINRPIDPDEILYFLRSVDSESQTV